MEGRKGGFGELAGAVVGVDWEEDCASLHYDDAWSEPHWRHEVSVDGLELWREDCCQPKRGTRYPVKSAMFCHIMMTTCSP